jgi:transposase
MASVRLGIRQFHSEDCTIALDVHRNDGLISHYMYLCLDELLTLHFLPGYPPDLNPNELVWSYAKRTGVARSPLKAGEKL